MRARPRAPQELAGEETVPPRASRGLGGGWAGVGRSRGDAWQAGAMGGLPHFPPPTVLWERGACVSYFPGGAHGGGVPSRAASERSRAGHAVHLRSPHCLGG